MRCKEVNIDKDNPFKDCKLDRKQNADVLTSIVKAYSNGFVLAVNGKWGTGKTTFMKMWKQSLKCDGYNTIFFNAWENDFTSKPMVALLGEIKSLVTPKTEVLFDNILGKVTNFTSKAIPVLAKTAATLGGLGAIAEAAEKISEVAIESMTDEIKKYDAKKESFVEIRKELSKFVKDSCGEKPLIFIVDELDRCRPDYAIEVLEKIKHLFAVDGVVFVLSIDKEQLGHAVRGYYGSESIDSQEYLRRFIDITFDLPEPNYRNYINHIVAEYKIPKNIDAFGRDVTDSIVTVISNFCHDENYTLRQLNKIFIHASLILSPYPTTYISLDILMILIAIREFQPTLYSKLKNGVPNSIVAKILEDIFAEHFVETKKMNHNSIVLICTLIRIIKMLPNNISSDMKIDKESLVSLFPKLQHFTETDIDIIIKFSNPRETFYDGSPITNYTNKIDLLENIKL